PAGDGGAIEQRGVAFGVAHDTVRRRRQDRLAEPPHPGRERAAIHATALVEPGPQRGAAQTGAGVVDLQEALARGAAQLRVGLGELVAAARAALPRTAHALASFSTSFRIPPAVTAGPAPGPVITSGFFRYRMVVKINWLSVPLSEAIGLDASTTTSPTRMRRRVTIARYRRTPARARAAATRFAHTASHCPRDAR